MGWILWSSWVGREQEEAAKSALALETNGDAGAPDDGSSASSTTSFFNPSTPSSQLNKENHVNGLGLSLSTSNFGRPLRKQGTGHSHSTSVASLPSPNSPPSPVNNLNCATLMGAYPLYSPYGSSTSFFFSPRNQQRLATVKSAFLIYCALLGLSPILKSLTKSTTSDSIWAMSCWLMIINIFCFDYGSGGGAGASKFPASLSTNAALMASTVLASRLPSTTHVFSLTLFSIEVFGLFPVFRRHLRHISWSGHIILTVILVASAGAGVGIILRGGWTSAILGILVGSLVTALVMGGCSWWLIGLQKYKNVVTGPWDPARPILRRHWD